MYYYVTETKTGFKLHRSDDLNTLRSMLYREIKNDPDPQASNHIEKYKEKDLRMYRDVIVDRYGEEPNGKYIGVVTKMMGTITYCTSYDSRIYELKPNGTLGRHVVR